MKKRFVKGILAAALAFVSVVGVPQSQTLNGILSPSVTASAACSHNYRHYYDYSEWVDEHYPIRIEDCEDEDGNRRKGIVFGSILMTDLLSEWQRRKKDLADGKISKAEYTEWKLNWPKTTDDCGKHEPAKEWRNL